MEEFKKIDDYENYEISNMGNVRNTDTNMILKPCKNRDDGYFRVSLSKNNIRKTFLIHRLVGFAFIPNPQNLPCIDHINQDKTNNSISNLRWVSKSNNNRNITKRQNTTSKFMGVSFHKRDKKYQARISINNKPKYIGLYEKEEEAGRAFDDYIKDHNLTEFYTLNFPEN